MNVKIFPVAVSALFMALLTAPTASAQALNSDVNYTLQLKDDRTVTAWGGSISGYGVVTDGVAVASGLGHAIALNSDGTVVAWGDATLDRTTVPAFSSTATAIAAGGTHSLALLSDHTVVAWGDNASQQSAVPTSLSSPPSGGDPHAIAISAGTYHSLALLSDGNITAWGSDHELKVSGAANVHNAIAIAAGAYHSLALQSDGTVEAWGRYTSNQTAVPTDLTNVAAIAAGENHSLALRSNGTVAAWGSDLDGQTSGAGTLTDVVYVTAGYSHNHAVHSDGSLTGWGNKDVGLLLNTSDPNLPTVAHWSAAENGDYLNSHRWAQSIPSTKLSTARFDEAGTYTVTFGNQARAANLEILAGDVTFAQQGNLYKVENTIHISESGTLRADGPLSANQVNNEGLIEIASGGDLTVNSLNNTGSLINNGAVNADLTITGTGELSGSGNLDGMLTIANGGSLAPGSSVGLLSGTASTFGPGGVFDFEINDAAAGSAGHDGLQLADTLDITANASQKFLVNIRSLDLTNNPGMAAGFDPSQDYSWAFVTAAGGINNFNADYFSIHSDGFQNGLEGGSFSINQMNNSLMLNFNSSLSAVPEPSSLALLGLSGLGWAGYRLRDKKRARRKNAERATS